MIQLSKNFFGPTYLFSQRAHCLSKLVCKHAFRFLEQFSIVFAKRTAQNTSDEGIL
jgi:hypothetical protein